jgi:hypothetical protein
MLVGDITVDTSIADYPMNISCFFSLRVQPSVSRPDCEAALLVGIVGRTLPALPVVMRSSMHHGK